MTHEEKLATIQAIMIKLDKQTGSRYSSVVTVADTMSRSQSTIYGWLSGRLPPNDTIELLRLKFPD